MSIEKPYEPTPEEMQNVEDVMTEEQKTASNERESIFQVAQEQPSRELEDILTPLTKGQIVTVERSSGDIENDWILFGYDKKTGDAIVIKKEEETGEILKKEIPRDELKDLNPETEELKFSEEFLNEQLKLEEELAENAKEALKALQERHRELIEKHATARGPKADDLEIDMDVVSSDIRSTLENIFKYNNRAKGFREKLAVIEQKKAEKSKDEEMETQKEEREQENEKRIEEIRESLKHEVSKEQGSLTAAEKIIWEEEIANSPDFKWLFDTISRLGEITGSDGYVYDADYLKTTINEVRVGKKELNFVTNSLGLRDKVSELLEEATKKDV